MGKDGWELVNIIPQISSNYDSSFGDIDLNIRCCEKVFVDYSIAVLKKEADVQENDEC